MFVTLALLLLAAKTEVQVRKVYITGNNEAASTVRRKLESTADKFGEDACLSVMSKPELADATLFLNEAETSGGLNAIAVLSPGPVNTTVVSAELDGKDGAVLWQDSKQGMAGIVSTGSAAGAGKVLESLYQELGCTKKGRR